VGAQIEEHLDDFSWQHEEEGKGTRRRWKKGELPEVVMPRCAAIEHKPLPLHVLQQDALAQTPVPQAPRLRMAAQKDQSDGDFGVGGGGRRKGSGRVSRAEIKQRLGNLVRPVPSTPRVPSSVA
jgi:hypothetical protein